MKTYRVKLTWVDGQGNAVCVGLDETVTIEADSEEAAKSEAISDALDFHATLAAEKAIVPEAEISNWEVASQECGGSWDLCGDFGSKEEAIAAAKENAAEAWHDDEGRAVFGITADPAGGAYEHRVTVHEDGTAILETDGAIVGTV